MYGAHRRLMAMSRGDPWHVTSHLSFRFFRRQWRQDLPGRAGRQNVRVNGKLWLPSRKISARTLSRYATHAASFICCDFVIIYNRAMLCRVRYSYSKSSLRLSVHLSVRLLRWCWNSSKIISRLDSAGCSLSKDLKSTSARSYFSTKFEVSVAFRRLEIQTDTRTDGRTGYLMRRPRLERAA